MSKHLDLGSLGEKTPSFQSLFKVIVSRSDTLCIRTFFSSAQNTTCTLIGGGGGGRFLIPKCFRIHLCIFGATSHLCFNCLCNFSVIHHQPLYIYLQKLRLLEKSAGGLTLRSVQKFFSKPDWCQLP